MAGLNPSASEHGQPYVLHPGLSGRLRADHSGESSSEVGHVNIKEATYALVKDEPGLTFTPRGLACPGLRAGVQAKGKGEMEMYFVEGQ